MHFILQFDLLQKGNFILVPRHRSVTTNDIFSWASYWHHRAATNDASCFYKLESQKIWHPWHLIDGKTELEMYSTLNIHNRRCIQLKKKSKRKKNWQRRLCMSSFQKLYLLEKKSWHHESKYRPVGGHGQPVPRVKMSNCKPPPHPWCKNNPQHRCLCIRGGLTILGPCH